MNSDLELFNAIKKRQAIDNGACIIDDDELGEINIDGYGNITGKKIIFEKCKCEYKIPVSLEKNVMFSLINPGTKDANYLRVKNLFNSKTEIMQNIFDYVIDFYEELDLDECKEIKIIPYETGFKLDKYETKITLKIIFKISDDLIFGHYFSYLNISFKHYINRIQKDILTYVSEKHRLKEKIRVNREILANKGKHISPIIKKVIELLNDSIKMYLPHVSKEDLEQNGAIFYMNGNFGTAGNWFENKKLPDFMIFYNDDKNLGAAKLILERNGSVYIYLYDDRGATFIKQIETKIDVTPEQMYYLAVNLQSEADDKRLWDADIELINSNKIPTVIEIKNFDDIYEEL